MKFKNILNIVLAAAFISGCASISTSSDYVVGADFSHLKTYDWVPGPQPVTGDPRIDNTLIDSRIRDAVDRTLASKGYQKQTAEGPDFLVGYQAAIQGKLDVMTTHSSMYAAPGTRDIVSGNFHDWDLAHGGSETFVTQYEEGSLIVDIVDPKVKKLMWRGTAKATLLDKAAPKKREARIREAVAKIFAKFPPLK